MVAVAENITLRCEAKIGGETVFVQQVIPAIAWDADEGFRDSVQQALRTRLALAIIEKWKPVIQVRRGPMNF